MIKKYEPHVKRNFDFYDEEYTYTSEMKESKNGEYVKYESYNSLLKEHNKLKKKLERYTRRLNILEKTKP